MSDHASLTRGWLLKADSDLAGARAILATPGPYDPRSSFPCPLATAGPLANQLANGSVGPNLMSCFDLF